MDNENDDWTPLRVDEIDIVAYARRVKAWTEDPSSDPEIEKWYKNGYSKGIPFQTLKDN